MQYENFSGISREIMDIAYQILDNLKDDIKETEILELLDDHFFHWSCHMKAIDIILSNINSGISTAELVKMLTEDFEIPY